MKLLKFVFASLALCFSVPAFAQSTAQPVLPGLLVTSGCPVGYTSCYLPYSNSNPLPVTVSGGGGETVTANQGTPNAGGATNSWPIQGAGVSGTPAGGVVSIQGVAGGVAQPISATSLPLPTGAATSALQSNVQAAATSTTPATVNFVEPVDSTGAQPNFATPVPVIMSDPYPSGATPVSCSTGNIAASTATCTMPAISAKFTYITGFDITGSGATLGLAVTCTLTNTGSGTHSYTYVAVAGALLANASLNKSFPTPLKATATNTAPVLSCPSLGTGNTNMTINMDGYTL